MPQTQEFAFPQYYRCWNGHTFLENSCLCCCFLPLLQILTKTKTDQQRKKCIFPARRNSKLTYRCWMILLFPRQKLLSRLTMAPCSKFFTFLPESILQLSQKAPLYHWKCRSVDSSSSDNRSPCKPGGKTTQCVKTFPFLMNSSLVYKVYSTSPFSRKCSSTRP